jgi:hypothetical protein
VAAKVTNIPASTSQTVERGTCLEWATVLHTLPYNSRSTRVRFDSGGGTNRGQDAKDSRDNRQGHGDSRLAERLPLAQVDAASTAARGLEGKEVSTQAKALEVFGADRQVDKCIEELAELATALVKYRHGEATAADVIDELADVEITTGTLRLLFDRQAIETRVLFKLSRLSRLVADQVATAKPEPKPVKPMLRWEVGKGDELVLYRWDQRIGSVSRSQYWADQWTATASSVRDVTTHAHKETAINIVCMNLGLSVCEVPVWKP